MATVTPRPLMLLLVVVISLVATAHTKALNCLNAETSTKNKPVIFDLNQQPVRSIRFTAPTNAPWDAVFAFGEQKDATEDFTTLINMEIKKKKQDAKIYPLKLYRQTRHDILLDERISNVWLDNGGQAIIHISNNKSSFSITFINDDREFLMELIDPEITGINSVQVNGDLEVASCEDLDRFPETTTTTTSTTTTKPTTTSTTTTTTTTTTSTTPSTTTITTTLPITTTVPVTSAIPTRVFLTTLDTLNATDDQLLYTEAEAVIGLGGSMDCKIVPVWAWACAGLAVVFFLFILGLLAYCINLQRRSWKGLKDLTTSNSGGFGLSAQDMHYYEMKNPNLMVGNTAPRIKTPRPSPIPGRSPTNSTYRLSGNRPSDSFRTSNTLNLPAPDVVESKSHTVPSPEKSRNSKVSSSRDELCLNDELNV